MHQYVIWTALASLDIGANLQHYNPVIDQRVADAWDIADDWELNAQMVFGAIEQPAGDKATLLFLTYQRSNPRHGLEVSNWFRCRKGVHQPGAGV